MGQRLVIKIKDSKGDLLATQYMHWSGYTGSTLECMVALHDTIKDMGEIREEKKYAVSLLRKAFTSAALTGEAARSLGIKETRTLNRNEGLIDITEEEMDDSVGWAEATCSVCLYEGYTVDELLWSTDAFFQQEIEEWVDEDPENFKLEVDGEKKNLFEKDSKTREWTPVPVNNLDFDGYPETWEQVTQLKELYEKSDHIAYCKFGEDHFILNWID